MALQQPQHKGKSLLDLPAEIRNDIYKLTLELKSAVDIKKDPGRCKTVRRGDSFCGADRTSNESSSPVVNVLRTCKTIQCEAVSILYGCNRFIADRETTLEIFLKQIGTSARHLRYVELAKCWRMDKFGAVLNGLRLCAALETVVLSFVRPGETKEADMAKKVLPLLKELKNGRGEENDAQPRKNVLDIVRFESKEVVGPFPRFLLTRAELELLKKQAHMRRLMLAEYTQRIRDEVARLLK